MSHSKPLPFERKILPNGKPNVTYVDLLEEDKPISGQAFGCFSFVSPEKILKQKEMFFFEEFLKKWEFNKLMEKSTQFLNWVSFKYHLDFDKLMEDYKEFVKEEAKILTESGIEDEYKTFLDSKEEELENLFNVKNNFQTSVRGLKFRGAYPTKEEAEFRCKLLREMDPNHDILVGPVGVWMPWDPEAYKTGKVEYLEEELNKLMSEKQENEKKAKHNFEERIKENKKKAIEENIKNAEKFNLNLTQTIDAEGNLIGANQTTQEQFLNNGDNNTISVADIRKELFEGDDIIMGKIE
jgi:hypothetical protein